MEVVIVGGGASGLAAAIEASRRAHVTVLERCARVGRKLAVTGNGRCNLTNLDMGPERYHGRDPGFVRPALERFGVSETLDFFKNIGLVTVSEPSGRVYPHSDQAGSVVDVLRFAATERGVELRCGFEVRAVRRVKGGFEVRGDSEALFCQKLIVAAGGIAGTKAGGTGLGYELLSSLGHARTALRPSLVQLKTENDLPRKLRGVRADAGVELLFGGVTAAESRGEVQFADYGLTGPAIFEISRAACERPGGVVRLDLLRRVPREELIKMLARRRAGELTAENLLTGILHNKLGRCLVTELGYSLTEPISHFTDGDLARVADAVKGLALPVTGDLGMEGAQVTAGGMRTEEFDPATLESRLVPGLYACGEVLDVDGDCGGYNLQWAWSSGRLAGTLGGMR